MNNPLMYTDPSGELWGLSAVASAAIIGAIIGGVVYTGMSLYHDNFSWGGLFKSVAIGAVSGVATSGIGTMANTFLQGSTGFWATAARESLRAVFHGYSQGFISGISGGDIGQGFVSGMASSVVSSVSMGINAAAGLSGTPGDISTMLFGSASGGLSSKLAGGNFWEGAAIGLTVSGLNHVAHRSTAKDSFEITEEIIEPTTGESEEGFLPPGKIRFEGLKDKHLKQFRVIPESSSELILPNNDITYQTDGFYHQNTTEDKYWYKIGGGRMVRVTYNGKSFDLSRSIFNPLGLGSYIGWKPKSEPHWTTNPFYKQ